MAGEQIMEKINWRAFGEALKIKPSKVIRIVKDSGLRGRSGSGYPTGAKWESIGNGKRVLICNADEGEPGNFKDRTILEKNPQALIEGMAIASYAMDIHESLIYLRGEYGYLKNKIEKEIEISKPHLKKIGLSIRIISGAGAYICGEESAILESIEGNRPIVRKKPPYPAQVGLYGRPTCINNVETLANVPLILAGIWNPNKVLFCISGDLESPGIHELEYGISLKELVSLGKPKITPKAVYFGASGGLLPYEQFKNITIDDKSVAQAGAMLGSRGIIVVGENRNMVEMSEVFTKFFVHESCGYCTPCREGNFRILELLRKMIRGRGEKKDLILLEKLIPHIRDTSYCALGRTSTSHLAGAMKYFRKEFEELCK